MTSTTYCYRRSEPSDDEDEHHIDRVVVDGEDEDDDKHVLKSWGDTPDSYTSAPYPSMS